MTTMIILEGRLCAQPRGWRHYQIVTKDKRSACVGHPSRMKITAEKNRVQFFEAGTWENFSVAVPPDSFHVPRPEILAFVCGQPDREAVAA